MKHMTEFGACQNTPLRLQIRPDGRRRRSDPSEYLQVLVVIAPCRTAFGSTAGRIFAIVGSALTGSRRRITPRTGLSATLLV